MRSFCSNENMLQEKGAETKKMFSLVSLKSKNHYYYSITTTTITYKEKHQEKICIYLYVFFAHYYDNRV